MDGQTNGTNQEIDGWLQLDWIKVGRSKKSATKHPFSIYDHLLICLPASLHKQLSEILSGSVMWHLLQQRKQLSGQGLGLSEVGKQQSA